MRTFLLAFLGLAQCLAWYGCASTENSDVIDGPDSEPRDEASRTERDSGGSDGPADPLDAGADVNASDGSDDDVIDEDPTANPIRSLSLGIDFGCAIVDLPDRSNVLKCWGFDWYGQVGVGRSVEYAYVAAPTEVVLPDVHQVALGSNFACAISDVGNLVRCWGNNAWFQLGNGIPGKTNAPPPNVTTDGAVEIAAGTEHACARTGSGMIFCWGNNGDGRLGVGDDTGWRVGPTLLDDFNAEGLALGDSHSCARSASGDEVWCWGWNFYGQLGIATSADGSPVPDGARPPSYSVPTRVTSLNGKVRQLAAALNDTCALMDDGTVQCWGRCSKGTCKDFYDPPQPNPVTIIDSQTQQPLKDVVKIAGGYSTDFTPELHFCALLTTGTVRCWGSNAHAQGGRPPSHGWSVQALPVPGLTHVTDIAAGSAHTCARVGERRLKCWGDNTYGALGQGAIQPGNDIRSTPQNVGL